MTLLLLNAGAITTIQDSFGRNALFYACINGDYRCAKLLKLAGLTEASKALFTNFINSLANPNSHNESIDFSVVSNLIYSDFNSKDVHGMTSLDHAVSNNCWHLLENLEETLFKPFLKFAKEMSRLECDVMATLAKSKVLKDCSILRLIFYSKMCKNITQMWLCILMNIMMFFVSPVTTTENNGGCFVLCQACLLP